MNANSHSHLAGRITTVARQHEAAMLHFESTGEMVAQLGAGARPPGEWDLYRCRDAVELCQWWTFNLERIDRSIEDLSPAAGERAFSLSGGDVESTGSAEYRNLVTEFERLRQMMEAVREEYSAALDALVSAAEIGQPPQVASLPDLEPLREVLAAAVERAETLSGATAADRGADSAASTKP